MSFGIFPCFPHCPRLDGMAGKQRMLGVDAMPHVHDHSIYQRISFPFLPQLVNPRTDYAKIGNLEEARTTHISPVLCLILYYILTTPSLYSVTEIASQRQRLLQRIKNKEISRTICQGNAAKIFKIPFRDSRVESCLILYYIITTPSLYRLTEIAPSTTYQEQGDIQNNMSGKCYQNFQDTFSRQPCGTYIIYYQCFQISNDAPMDVA